MLEDVSVYGVVLIGISSFLLCWFSSSTIIIVAWTILAVIYTKNRWFGDQHASNSLEQHEQPQLQPSALHKARKRSNKDDKKYTWDSYDSSFNEHWRQRLMSFTVPASTPRVATTTTKRVQANASPTFRKQELLLQKTRISGSHSPPNKQSNHSSGKRAVETLQCELRTSPAAKTHVYTRGVYPRVSFDGVKPHVLSHAKSHLTKSRVTVKLSPMQPTTPPTQVEPNLNNEQSLVANLRKSTRKRQMKSKQQIDSSEQKKQRVENNASESMVHESVLPDHFIENANTVSEALKRLEKVQKVLGSPKTNAIESSLSSMKRFRTKPLKRDLIETEEDESPKAKIFRRETEISPVSAFNTNDDIIVDEIQPVEMEEECPEPTEKETDSSPEMVTRPIYIPSLQDHLKDRRNNYDRLQQILKQFAVGKDESIEKSTEVLKPVQSHGLKQDISPVEAKSEAEISSTTPENRTNCDSVIANNAANTSATEDKPQPPSTVKSNFVLFDKPSTANLNLPTSTPLQLMTAISKTSPNHCNGLLEKAEEEKPVPIGASIESVTPVKAVPAFQFGGVQPQKTETSSSGVFTFGNSIAQNGVTNGFQFTTNPKPSFSMGSEEGTSMFSMGSGSTAPRRSKVTASRNRFR